MSTTNPIAVRGVSAVAVEIQSDAYTRRADIITRIRQGEREIPGLRIYQDTRVTVRT